MGTRLIEIRRNYDLRTLGVEPIEQAIAQEVTSIVKPLVAKLQELGIDSLGIGQMIARKNPRAWYKLEPKWNEVYPRMRIDVVSKATVRQTGFILKFFDVVRQDDR